MVVAILVEMLVCIVIGDGSQLLGRLWVQLPYLVRQFSSRFNSRPVMSSQYCMTWNKELWILLLSLLLLRNLYTAISQVLRSLSIGLHSAGLGVELGIHVDIRWLWKPFLLNAQAASHHIQPPQVSLKHVPNADRLSNCCFLQRALHGIHSPCSYRSVVRWGGHMRCQCVHCLCLEGRVSFSTKALVQSLTTANRRRT